MTGHPTPTRLLTLDLPNGDRIVERLHPITDRDREIAGPLLERAIADVVATTGLHPKAAAAALLGAAVEAKRDREAYEREALRRGLLPL